MSGSRNESVTIKITLEIARKGAAQLAVVEVEPRLSEAEGQYCDCRARDISEPKAQVKPGRVHQMVVISGLSAAALLLTLVIGTLAISIVTNPFTAIGASIVLAATLRSIAQMIGQVAAPNRD